MNVGLPGPPPSPAWWCLHTRVSVGFLWEHGGQDRVERLVSWSPDQLGVVMEGPGLGVHLDVECMSLISPAKEV